MGGLDAEELAQLGLKHIEDAVVAVLTRHTNGLTANSISQKLGLGEGLSGDKRMMIVTAILGLLLESGRVLWNATGKVYVDNPQKI